MQGLFYAQSLRYTAFFALVLDALEETLAQTLRDFKWINQALP